MKKEEKIKKILKELKEDNTKIINIEKAIILPELDLDKFEDELVKKAFELLTHSSK
jgi:hypothetical protein